MIRKRQTCHQELRSSIGSTSSSRKVAIPRPIGGSNLERKGFGCTSDTSSTWQRECADHDGQPSRTKSSSSPQTGARTVEEGWAASIQSLLLRTDEAISSLVYKAALSPPQTRRGPLLICGAARVLASSSSNTSVLSQMKNTEQLEERSPAEAGRNGHEEIVSPALAATLDLNPK
ncbi:hypothetical protein GWK47_024925 [Chionoecetes opilio]|uniref:Uncharacterized protein n=1 Tax=Chionoecetes opilio TaxID=41210 RepID=A0A8J5BSX4_CHIOP|nr:hypothetical protein GWK47_024925 [Chionoecetes opilio]